MSEKTGMKERRWKLLERNYREEGRDEDKSEMMKNGKLM